MKYQIECLTKSNPVIVIRVGSTLRLQIIAMITVIEGGGGGGGGSGRKTLTKMPKLSKHSTLSKTIPDSFLPILR